MAVITRLPGSGNSDLSSRLVLALLLILPLLPPNTSALDAGANANPMYSVKRLNDGKPVITSSMFAALGVPEEGENINGPSVIRLPDWLTRTERASPEANYYMYFARHGADRVGDYIRMAWAAHPEGPWTLFRTGKHVYPGNRGVLDTGAAGIINISGGRELTGSVGSPDVIVDHANQRIIMYFHAKINLETEHSGINQPGKLHSKAFVATSPNGLDFNQPGNRIRPRPLGGAYFRTFEASDWLYAIGNTGTMYRAPAPGYLTPLEEIWAQSWEKDEGPLKRVFDAESEKQWLSPQARPRFRHFAVLPAGGELHVFFSRKNDMHERIQMTIIEISGNDHWHTWSVRYPPWDILKPELAWEGADLAPRRSRIGPETGVRQLRDPYVLKDADGSLYLFYTGRGEEAIGVALLVPEA
nr:hypothetical protein [uncultured Gammaproteobacteria bacterium]